MYLTLTAIDRVFSVGDGCPVTHRRIADATVTSGPIIADARTDSEAASVSVQIARVGGSEGLFWPPPVGAQVALYDSDTDALIVAGVLASIDLGDDIGLQVQL